MKYFHELPVYWLQTFILAGVMGLSSCGDAGFVTPPQQYLGSTLNTSSAEESPRFSYDGRFLVFASDRQAQRSIFLYDTRQRRLMALPGLNQPGRYQDQPDISADGRYIVYVSEQSGKPDIYVYDRQTLKADNITKHILGQVRHPTISGNGRFVAFESDRWGQWNVEIYDRGSSVPISPPQGLGGNEVKKEDIKDGKN